MNNPDHEYDLDIWDKVIKVNLYGTMHTAKYCVEAMKVNEPNEHD